MKVGVFSFVFQDLLPFDQALDWISGVGAEAVEIGSGGYVAELGESYCKPKELLADSKKLAEWKPQLHQEEFRHTVLVAEKIGVRRVVTFSGCPGDSENSKYPNWVTCPWPPDFLRILEWQWEEKVIPYWQGEVGFCREHGVDMIALEMHPGFVVYNPETLLRLREAIGPEIGVNFDPSHLFWQGIDPIFAVRELGESIFHVHAKDTIIDPVNTPVNGVLDTKPYADEANRAWIFRTVGYGHDLKFWKDLVSNLRLVGYDYVLSMEHEDSLMSLREGLEKGVGALRELVLTDERGKPWFES
jgi:sugar phosphate isomerase/epimerase